MYEDEYKIMKNLIKHIGDLSCMSEWMRKAWLRRFRFLKTKSYRHEIWIALGKQLPYETMKNIKEEYYSIELPRPISGRKITEGY